MSNLNPEFPSPKEQLLDTTIFFRRTSQEVKEASKKPISLCLALFQYPLQQNEAVNAILNIKNSDDVAGELGGRIGILSKQPQEQIIRSALELIKDYPDIVVGVKIYDVLLDADQTGAFIKRAEDTLKAAVVVGAGKVAVLGRLFALRKFTVEERGRIITPGQVEKIISEHK